MFTSRFLSVMFALGALAACSRARHAALDDAGQLAESSPVYVSGVKVGEVESVRIDGDHVDVAFSIDGDQRVTLHGDACASAAPLRDGPALVILPGHTGAFEEDAPLPQCHLTADALNELASTLGSLVQGAMGEMLRGLTTPLPGGGGAPVTGPLPFPWSAMPMSPFLPPAAPPAMPVPPSPAVTPQSSPCDHLSVRIDGTEDVAAVPLLLPNGGRRAFLVLANDGDEPLELDVNAATFLTAGHVSLPIAHLPGTQDWFMPLAVAPHASTRTSVVLPPTETLAAVELTARSPTDPSSTCRTRPAP